MKEGYVALLDVLVFSDLAGGDHTGGRISRYLECVRDTMRGQEINYVVFSDSIVLSAKGDTPPVFLISGIDAGCRATGCQYLSKISRRCIRGQRLSAHAGRYPSVGREFDGFAVVPTNGTLEFAAIRDSIKAAMDRLQWLRTIAPTPDAQLKYQRTIDWLMQFHFRWHDLAFEKGRVAGGSG